MKSEIYDEVKAAVVLPQLGTGDFETLSFFAWQIHANNVLAGWWTDLIDGKKKDRNFGELCALVHSEISEAMEGHRKSLMDDHLPQYPMWWVELADAFIRIADMAGAGGVPFGEVVQAKLAYNAQRADHKPENRAKADGKKY